MSDEKRVARWFWAHSEGRVSREQGWTCAPANPGYWWVPSLGGSAAEGATLFPDTDKGKRAAMKAALAWIDEQQATLGRKVRAILEMA